jgi:hypothetical protein
MSMTTIKHGAVVSLATAALTLLLPAFASAFAL